MKTLTFNILLAFISFNLSLVGFAQTNLGSPNACNIALRGWVEVPPGQKYWGGTFVCRGKGCGIETPAVPDDDGQIRCSNCGKVHDTELIRDPETKNENNKFYVLNPAWVGTSLPPKSVRIAAVPSTTIPLDEQSSVETPIASTPEENPAPLADRYSSEDRYSSGDERYPYPSQSSNDSFDQESLREHLANSLNRYRSTNSTQPIKAWIKIGSATVAAITAGALIWGIQTFAEPGVVSMVNQDHISVRYSHNEKSYSIDLDPEALKSGVRWREGEPVTLHFTNGHWFQNEQPIGAERSNAEVYAPILLERSNTVD
jgi:hypothetical protein